jgi:hypothetical protein
MKNSSKELFKANGGNKWHIYKDGHMNGYSATAEEEATWTQELIQEGLQKLNTETNLSLLLSCLETLGALHTENLEKILLDKLELAPPKRQNAIAFYLWRSYKFEKSFLLIKSNLLAHPVCQDDAFYLFSQMFGSRQVTEFFIECLEGENVDLYNRAKKNMWGILFRAGATRLQESEILTLLNRLDRSTNEFKQLICEMKLIVQNDRAQIEKPTGGIQNIL